MSTEVINLTKVELKKVLSLNKSIPKREAIEKVKLQVLKALGSRVKSIGQATVEKTVLQTIEEVWTDMHAMFNEETG